MRQISHRHANEPCAGGIMSLDASALPTKMRSENAKEPTNGVGNVLIWQEPTDP